MFARPPKQRIPQVLYKYVTYKTARAILEYGSIRFTQPRAFNDPFDLHPSFQLASLGDISKLPRARGRTSTGAKMRRMTPEFAQQLQLLADIASLTIANPVPGAAYSINNNDIGLAMLERLWGVLCLTESPSNLLMWAHYADSHRGCVLQFDTRHPFFREGAIGPVLYTKARPAASLSSLSDPSVFLHKGEEWSYEREWRDVRPLAGAARVDDSDKQALPMHLFALPLSAVVGVVTGAGMPEDQQKSLVSLCAERTPLARIYQALLSPDEFAVEIPGLDPHRSEGRVWAARENTITPRRGLRGRAFAERLAVAVRRRTGL